MNSLKQRLKVVPKGLWWASGLLLVSALLGFLLLSWVAERQTRGLLQERLGLAGEIETIHFNSFTFFAQVEGLVIRQADGAPLLQLGLLQVNF